MRVLSVGVKNYLALVQWMRYDVRRRYSCLHIVDHVASLLSETKFTVPFSRCSHWPKTQSVQSCYPMHTSSYKKFSHEK